MTKNQRAVADALKVARDHGFEAGLTFLLGTGRAYKIQPGSIRVWFRNKCHEHGILIEEAQDGQP